MEMTQQIEKGCLRCVRSGEALMLDADALVSRDGKHRYALANGKVPVVLSSEDEINAVLRDNPAMETEYRKPGLYQRLRDWMYVDYNSREFCAVLDEAVLKRSPEQLTVSIGGGPIREAAHITNLNIGTFPNVDIVGDAHDLPYVDASVDTVYCTAVLEHVQRPIKAVQEMHRVLKPGAQVLSVIPFMQAYHGYPHHYQNYTQQGHEYLYTSNGFRVLKSGACLGPVVAMTVLSARFFLEYLPKPLNIAVGRGMQMLGLVLRPLDRLLEKHPGRHILSSATYVLAQKV